MSEPSVTIDLEDFRRLGIRPDETRTAVIRLATARNAKPLSEQNLQKADPQIEAQLSRVATSAYRLLDPRRRDNEQARTRVGRILPLALRTAGKTPFAASPTQRSLDAAFAPEAVVEPDALEIDDWFDFERPEDDTFVDSMLHEDVPGDRWKTDSQGLRETERPLELSSRGIHSRRILLACSAAIVVIVCAVAWSTYLKLQRHHTDRPFAVVSPGFNDWDRAEFRSLPLEFTTPEPKESDGSDVIDRALAFTSSDLAPIMPPRWSSKTTTKESEGVPTEELNSHFQRPTRQEVKRAREALEDQFPELRRVSLPDQASRQIEILRLETDTLERGSTNDWTCRLMIAELSWLVDDPLCVRTELQVLAQRFGQPLDELVSSSFSTAGERAVLPETHQHLLRHGMPLADELLIAESFEASREIVKVLMTSAQTLDQKDSIRQLRALATAIEQAESLSLMVVSPSDPSATDADPKSPSRNRWGVMGRYYCLYLRRWDVGLPWLTEAADSRLASVARRQLALDEAASVQEKKEVADLWLSAANRASGRVQDSMRLHGIEMLEALLPQASGLEKLEVSRSIRAEVRRLPDYLRRPLVTG
ncbi:MAG: hypothetical protein AAGG48_08680 [Planctomycetota bacterium]